MEEIKKNNEVEELNERPFDFQNGQNALKVVARDAGVAIKGINMMNTIANGVFSKIAVYEVCKEAGDPITSKTFINDLVNDVRYLKSCKAYVEKETKNVRRNSVFKTVIDPTKLERTLQNAAGAISRAKEFFYDSKLPETGFPEDEIDHEVVTNRLNQLIGTELDSVYKEIQNESIWRRGSTTDEDAAMHDRNAKTLLEYKETLLYIAKSYDLPCLY